MISSDVLRGYCDTILLHILLEGDSYGYEISRRIGERSGGRFTMKETTLYAAMARMEKRGLIASYYGDETFGRRRTYYTVTSDGAAYYREKCAEWAQTREVLNRFTAPGGQMKEEGTDEPADPALCGSDLQRPAQDEGRGGDEAEHHRAYDGPVRGAGRPGEE